jgi:hypothetical protein
VAAFDAGSIESRLAIDTSQFDHDLDAAEARVKRFESEGHRVKISAEFDSSSVTKARQQFAQLDQQISKDAMNRLRSSPQGSVLGALNALFSPHPVTGAPTPQQAAQQGLLGKILTQPGGGGQAGPSSGTSGTTTQGSVVQQVLGDSAGTTSQGNANQRVSTVGLPNTTTTDNVNVVGAPTDNSIKTTDTVNTVGLPTDNTINTTDRVNTVGLPTSGGSISTEDRVNVTGLPTSGGTITTDDKVKPELDEASLKEQADKAGTDAADTTNDSMTKESKKKGSGWFSGFLSGIPSMIAGLLNGNGTPGTSASSGGGGNAKGTSLLTLLGGGGNGESSSGEESVLDKGLLGAIGPGILGTSFKTASIAGLGAAALGGLPALVGGALPLTLAGAGAGIVTAGASQLIGSANTKANPNAQGPLFAQAQAAGKALQAMVQTAAAGLTKPLSALFAQVPELAKQVTPALSQIFSSTAGLIQPVVTGLVGALRQIAPGLSAAFRATGPLLQPLISGIGGLVSGLLPGLVSLLKAAAPAVSVLSGFFKDLGANLGSLFQQFSTVVGPSSAILRALLGVVSGLLPVIGGLATVMAGTLGPAFTAFAGTIQALEPFLVGIGKIFAQFAGAVLTDLSGGLQLVASVLKAVAPAFNVLATSLGSVFTTLESKGGFAQLGDVLEGIAAPLGNLITSLVRGLAPAIPPILTLFSDLVNVVSTVGVKVLTALIPPITNLAEIALGALMRVLPVVLPVVTQFINVFTADAGQVIAQVGAAVLNLATVALLKLLQAAQPLIPVTLSLLNAFTPLLNILTPVVADTISAIAGALAAIVNAIPPGVIAGIAVSVGTVVAAFKAWGAVTAVLSSGIESVLAGAIGGIIGSLREFALATEGVTLAEKAQLAGMLALDALNPFGWAVIAAVAVGALGAAIIRATGSQGDLIAQIERQNNATGFNIAGYQAASKAVAAFGAVQQKVASQPGISIRGDGGVQSIASAAQKAATQLSQTAVNMQTRLTALSGSFGVSKTTIEQWAIAAGITPKAFAGAGESVQSLTSQMVDFINKNAQAYTATQSLSTNIAIFGDDVFSTTTQLDAFNQIWNTLVGNLLSKQEAVTNSQAQFDNLASTIKTSGANSDSAKQSFQQYISQIGSSASTLVQQGSSISTVNAYLQGQIDNITKLGPLNAGEKADLASLKTFQDALANSTKGLTDNQLTWIQQMEGHVIADLQAMGVDTPKVNTDIGNLANSIAQTGTTSASTAGDRAQLIKDLEAAGLNAKDATTFVDGLSTSLSKVPKSVGSNVTVTATALGQLDAQSQASGANIQTIKAILNFAANGMLVTGGTPGKDSVLVAAEPGEVIVPTAMVNAGAVDHLRGKIPGFASGGVVDFAGPARWASGVEGQWATSVTEAWMKQQQTALNAAVADAAKAAAAAFIGSGGASGGIIQAMMQTMAAAKGWTGAELSALFDVEQREAGFDMTATNPTSGAYGLAQFINGPSEYAQYGGNSTTAQGQITGMLNYISSRYGDPIAAWAHEQQFGWYDHGGPLKPGYTLAYNGTGRTEQVVSGKSMDDLTARLDQLHADMREMVSATRAVPAGVGQHVGGTINGAAHDASFRSRYPRGGS